MCQRRETQVLVEALPAEAEPGGADRHVGHLPVGRVPEWWYEINGHRQHGAVCEPDPEAPPGAVEARLCRDGLSGTRSPPRRRDLREDVGIRDSTMG